MNLTRISSLQTVAPPAKQPQELFLQVGRKRYQVASFAQASEMFCMARDKMGEGSSNTPTPELVDETGQHGTITVVAATAATTTTSTP